MKIVYISNSIIPSRTANSIHVMKMCQAFAKCGHEVVLLAPNRKDAGLIEAVDDIYEYYGVERCFRMVKIPLLPVRRGMLVYGVMCALRARTLFADLVYGRFLPGCYYSSVLRMPVMFESHHPGANLANEAHFEKLTAKRSLRCLVVISHSLKQYYMANYSIPEDRIVVAPDGADEVTGQIGEKTELGNADRLQAGYIGHLYPGKGIEVIADLARRCSWADFHIVGGMDEDIDRWKNELQDLHNIRFHGFVPHGQIGSYLQAFDVLLAPYQCRVSASGGRDIAEWMSPLKLFEYMAVGKPIVCSDLPVLREVLEDGRTALLCPPDDVSRWEAALCRLQHDVSLRAQLGENARSEFLQKYTWEARAKKLLGAVDLCRGIGPVQEGQTDIRWGG